MAPGAQCKRIFVHLVVACVFQAVAPMQASFAGVPQENAVNTPGPADFETARKAASDELVKARAVLDANQRLRNSADDAASKLKQYTSSQATDASALTMLSNIDNVLQSLLTGSNGRSVVDALSNAGTNATTEKTALDPLKKKLDDLKADSSFSSLSTDARNQFSQTLNDCAMAQSQLAKDGDLDNPSASALQATLAQVIVQAQKVSQAWTDTFAPLNNLITAPETDNAKLAKIVGASLPLYADVVPSLKKYTDQWTAIKGELVDKKLLQSPASAPVTPDKVDALLTSLAGSIPKIAAVITVWATTLKDFAQKEADAVRTLTGQVDNDAASFTASGVAQIRKDTAIHDSIQGVSDAWDKLIPLASLLGTPGNPFPADDVGTVVADMNKSNQALNGQVASLQEAIAGDFSQFEADQVPLFYFTDVSRLIKMLNPAAYEIGGIKGAQEQAQALRQKLTQAELELTEAQGEVNRYQTRLAQLPEELKQARADARRQDGIFGKMSNRLGSLTDQLTAATTDYNTKNSSATQSPTDQQKQADLQNALKKKNSLTSSTADAQRDNVNAQHDKDVADQKLTAAEDEQTGIPAQIEQAKLALSTAQTNVAQRRQESLLAAQAESDAFAVARNNAPYWFAPATGVSKDAARRVEMYGTDDSKIIYLRGKRADLEEVKNIIAGIDSPAPQARLTLWSLQLNYTNDAKGRSAEEVNKALYDVEDRLAEIRTGMAASVSLLRDAVNAQVNQSVSSSNCASKGECRLERIQKFYNRQVLLRLGDTGDRNAFKTLSEWTVPDPAGTTTLGEALMVLSLAQPSIRQAVFQDFLRRITERKNALSLRAARNPIDDGEQGWEMPFRNTLRVLDLDANDAKSAQATNELTWAQLEITRALESVAYQRLVKHVASLLDQLKGKNEHLAAACKQIAPVMLSLRSSQPAPCVTYPIPAPSPAQAASVAQLAAQRDLLLDDIYATQADVQSASSELVPPLWYLWQNYGASPSSILVFSDKAALSAQVNANASIRDQLTTQITARSLLARYPLKESNAREAAGDEMLKEMMTAMEEDLDRHFVRPGVARLRADIMGHKVQVGILQRTSVLATNRLVARVDPRSSAQLALGEQQDILQSVMQLGQIYLAAQSGGVLGTFSALKSLQGQTTEPPQEIYGITTGNTFKVTPIFDPSGQALRFQFDYVAANTIQEPNGTTNAQLPRIERHTVNTEVQISNLELREISRYEANSKLGLPTKFWGGVPLFKDLPGFRPWVPLLGWFVRKAGSGAASQESLLFGQSTIYPTIGEIMDLLTEPINPGGRASN